MGLMRRQLRRLASVLATLFGLFALAVLVAFIESRMAVSLDGPFRAVDGDSLTKGGESMRLTGIDAPELAQRCRDGDGRVYACGRAARDRLGQLAGRPDAVCRSEGTDRYDRLLVRCHTRDGDMGETLVREGLAIAYGGFHAAERAARRAGRGLWAGEFERPSRWREVNRSDPAAIGLVERLVSRVKRLARRLSGR